MSLTSDLSSRFNQLSERRSRAFDNPIGADGQQHQYYGATTAPYQPLAPPAPYHPMTASVSVATSPMRILRTHEERTYAPIEERTILIGGGDIGRSASRRSSTTSLAALQNGGGFSSPIGGNNNYSHHLANANGQYYSNANNNASPAPVYRSQSVVSSGRDDGITTVVEQTGYVVRKDFVADGAPYQRGGGGGGGSGGGYSPAGAGVSGPPLGATQVFLPPAGARDTLSPEGNYVDEEDRIAGDHVLIGGGGGGGRYGQQQQLPPPPRRSTSVHSTEEKVISHAVITSQLGGGGAVSRRSASPNPLGAGGALNYNQQPHHNASGINRVSAIPLSNDLSPPRGGAGADNRFASNYSAAPPLTTGALGSMTGVTSMGGYGAAGMAPLPSGLSSSPAYYYKGGGGGGGNTTALSATTGANNNSVVVGSASTDHSLPIHDNFAAQRHPYSRSGLIPATGGGRYASNEESLNYTVNVATATNSTLMLGGHHNSSSSLLLPHRSASTTNVISTVGRYGSAVPGGGGGLGVGVGGTPSFYKGARGAAGGGSASSSYRGGEPSAMGGGVSGYGGARVGMGSTPLTDAIARRFGGGGGPSSSSSSSLYGGGGGGYRGSYYPPSATATTAPPLLSYGSAGDDRQVAVFPSRRSTSREGPMAGMGMGGGSRRAAPLSSALALIEREGSRGGEQQHRRGPLVAPIGPHNDINALVYVGGEPSPPRGGSGGALLAIGGGGGVMAPSADPFSRDHYSVNLYEAEAAAEPANLVFPASANPTLQTIAPFNGLLIPIPSQLMRPCGGAKEEDTVVKAQVLDATVNLGRSLALGAPAEGGLSLLQRVVMRCRALRGDGGADLGYTPLPPHPLLEEAFHRTVRAGTMMALYSTRDTPKVRHVRLDIMSDHSLAAATSGGGGGSSSGGPPPQYVEDINGINGNPFLVWSKHHDSPSVSGTAPIWDLVEVSTSPEGCPVLSRYYASLREDVPSRRVGGAAGRGIVGPRLGGSLPAILPSANVIRMLFGSGMELVWVALEEGAADAWASALHYIAVETRA